MRYNFYYDESEHSRSINLNTISADNFYDNFVAIIVGWKADIELKLQESYHKFEDKYIYRHPDRELKSKTIKPNQLLCGFSSMNNENVAFLSDYLDLFSNDVYVYIATFSKIEFIVNQLFKDYKSTLLFDMDMMKYSIIKALVIYKPQELVDAIYNNPQNIVAVMRNFFENKIEKNKANPSLKERENKSFEQILLLLKDVKPIERIDWDYTPPFVGFRRFLDENSISEYSLTIDREGEHQKTVLAAREVGLINVDDEKSDKHFGIRMADMLAGLVGKLMKALCKAIHPTNTEVVEKTILCDKWFDLTEDKLVLYKKLHHVICELNTSYYKSFAGIYADDLVCFNALLNFMNHFVNSNEIKSNIKMQGEYFNGFACTSLAKDYQRKQSKLPIDPIPISNSNKDYFFNQRGAKVYFDTNKQGRISIPEGKIKYKVLSVGFDNDMIPLVTVEEQGIPMCYRLPIQLAKWAFTMVALANTGESLLPSEVLFTKRNNQYFVDIL